MMRSCCSWRTHINARPGDADVMQLSEKMHLYESIWWSMEVAPGWLAKDTQCITFCRADGVGALQISAYKHDSGVVPEDDLRDFIKDGVLDEGTLQHVRCGDFTGSGVEYVLDGDFWLKRWLHNGPLLLYVTYNSNAKDRALEIDDVSQMINTLKPR